jgi:predicted transcriptional regulator
MKSTVGRPRRVTDEDIARILAWHAEVLAWRAMGAGLKSRRALAQELGISPSTVAYVISRRGQYKQPSPEKRDGELDERHHHVAQLRTRGLL